MLSLVDLVVLGDAMVRRRLVTPEGLARSCEASRHKAAAPARRAAAYVRRDVDSPMETRLRMLIVLAGLPEPVVNLKVRDETGDVLRRYDLSYPAVKVAVEFNGKVHVLVPGAWEADLERRSAVDDSDWRLMPVISSGIYAAPAQTLGRVHRVLLARGLPAYPCGSTTGGGRTSRGTPTRREHVRRVLPPPPPSEGPSPRHVRRAWFTRAPRH